MSAGGVFIAMLAGLSMAAVTLVVEVVYHRRKLQQLTPANKRRLIVRPQLPKKESAVKKPVSILKKTPSVTSKNDTPADKDRLDSKTAVPKVSYITVSPKQWILIAFLCLYSNNMSLHRYFNFTNMLLSVLEIFVTKSLWEH